MKKQFDVVVVGAGPAGCMAAKTIAENGFHVALLDMKEHIADITRTCGQAFLSVDEEQWNEIHYFTPDNRRFVFPKLGFTVKYEGPYNEVHGIWIHSPNMKSIKLGSIDKPEVSGYSIDKSSLIEGILHEAQENGAEIFAGRNTVDVRKSKNGAEVVVKRSDAEEVYEGKFVIAADGVNSRLVDKLGLNSGRQLYVVEHVKGAYVQGARIPPQRMFNVFLGGKVSPSGLTVVLPTPNPEIMLVAAVTYPVFNHKADETLKYFLKESAVAKNWFTDIKVIKETSAVVQCRSPIETPFKDNVLCIGDASYLIETLMTGALMCGWKAGNVISTAVWQDKLNREGVQDYLDWWKKSFITGNDTAAYFKDSHCFSHYYTEEEVNYLIGLFDNENFPTCTWSHKFARIFAQSMSAKLPGIAKERPDLFNKLKKFQTAKPEELLPKSD